MNIETRQSKRRTTPISAEHLDGENLDRFSGYDFGIFGDSTVAGYQSGLVRAHQANGLHLSAGINYLDRIRFDAEVDAVWASNDMTGLDNDLLAWRQQVLMMHPPPSPW